MTPVASPPSAAAVLPGLIPLEGTSRDFDPLLDRIGDASLVMLGEATHGTHDFYRMRAELTKRLIREKGFVAVAAEADWPDAARVNRYVRGVGDDRDATEALDSFRRFPAWMWRNADGPRLPDQGRPRSRAACACARRTWGAPASSTSGSSSASATAPTPCWSDSRPITGL